MINNSSISSHFLLYTIPARADIAETLTINEAYIKDFESSNVQNSYEIFSGQIPRIQGFVASFDENIEKTVVESLSHGSKTPIDLFQVLTLVDPFGPNLDPWLTECLQQVFMVHSNACRSLLCF